MTTHTDASLYSQLLVSGDSFADAMREAALWLDQHENDVAVVHARFQITDDEQAHVRGFVLYTEG